MEPHGGRRGSVGHAGGLRQAEAYTHRLGAPMFPPLYTEWLSLLIEFPIGRLTAHLEFGPDH